MAFDLQELVDLGLFARVAEARSFSAAARQTGIAKSAVSRRIRLLEARLGLTLVRRSTRAVTLTADGARVYEHCRRLIDAAQAAEAEARGAGVRIEGLIRISAPVTLAHMHLARMLASFQDAHPGVDVRLTVSDTMVDALASEFDLVVRVTRLVDGAFVAHRLATDRLVVAGAPSYLDRRGRPRRSAELAEHNRLHYGLVDPVAEWRFGPARAPEGSARVGDFTVNDGTVLRQMMLAGRGLAVLPLFMVADDVAAGRAELVLDGQRRAEIGIYAVVAGRRQPLRVRRLIEHLRARFARSDWRTAR